MSATLESLSENNACLTFARSRIAATLVGLSALGLTVLPSPAHADLSILSIETLMHAQSQSAAALAIAYPSFQPNVLNYDFYVNTNDGSFSYDIVAGQTYNGLDYSLSGAGAYDIGTNSFTWSASGSLGTDTWNEQGYALWVGDPTATVTGTVSVNGQVIGAATGTLAVDGQGHSSGTVTYTPTGGSPGQYTITDYVPGNPGAPWTLKWRGKTGQFVPLSAKWVTESEGAGVIRGSSTIAAAPEPSTWALMLLGFMGLGLALRGRPALRLGIRS